MHKLLATQIKRHMKEEQEIPPGWKEFIEAVSLAYQEFNDDYALMERAMNISSEELMEKNSALTGEILKRKQVEDKLMDINLELEQRVKIRTKELNQTNQKLNIEVNKLNESESRIRTIMNSVVDGIVTIDEDGIIESINPAAEQIFGYGFEELIGYNVTCLIPESYRKDHENAMIKFKETGVHTIIGQYLELEGLRKDGSMFPLCIAINRMRLRDRYRFTGVVRDITEQKQKEIELIQAKEEAEKSNQAKSEFLSSMSHELRTPMNAILGFSQLLTTNTLDPLSQAQASQTNEIYKAGNHLLELINEILNLSGIESGEISLSIENIYLAELIDDILSLVTPLADKKSITVFNQTIEQPDNIVFADKIRLKQVLLNIISNAIKYTLDGGTITFALTGPKDGMVTISIADTGIGVPKEKIGSLFEPFNRLGAEQTEVEGTGIGLSIAKQLIELMRGTISVVSTVGKGSTFSVQIPEGKIQELPLPAHHSTSQLIYTMESSKPIHTLLYVEDNPANLRLVEEILKARNDIKLFSAPKAELGIDLARYHRPDLILMDIHLPGLDGITALKYLKTSEATRSIPVIAVSANAMQSDIDKAMEAGFDSYITKPIRVGSFMEKIDSHLGNNP